jgi:putative tricarboxylic transport membrane protein
MKFNDSVWGALIIVLGAAILVHIRTFPTIPGQDYGPALFPGVIAVGLLICGAGLIRKGLAVRHHRGADSAWVAFDAWTRSRRHVIAFGVVIGVNVLYIMFVDRLGFIVTGVLYMGALFTVFGVRPRWIIPLAIAVTFVIHYAFYKLLHVPLPWGVLEPVEW